MTKTELIRMLSCEMGDFEQSRIDAAVRLTINVMRDAIVDDRRIEIRNFGCFTTKYLPARMCKNPKTSEKVMVPERRSVHFKAGKELKELVNRDTVNE